MSLEENNKERKKVSKKVIAEIKKNQMKMKPSCYFILSSLTWFALGAVFFGVSLLLIAFGLHYLSEYEFLSFLLNGKFSGWFLTPLLAIFISILLLYASSRFYRKGRICCRHEEWMLLFAIGVVALIGIFILARSDVFAGKREMVEHFPVTQKVVISAKGFWFNPEDGRMFGSIVDSNKKEQYILIRNQQDTLYKIYTKGCDECEVDHKNAEKGDQIKLTGDFNGEKFTVQKIWLWE